MAAGNERQGDVRTIIHSRPEAHAFQVLEESEASAAVFCGAGNHFCARWGLKLAASLSDPLKCEGFFNDHAFPVGSAPDGFGAAWGGMVALMTSERGALAP